MNLSHSVTRHIVNQNFFHNYMNMIRLMAFEPPLSPNNTSYLKQGLVSNNFLFDFSEDGTFNEAVLNALYIYGRLKSFEISEQQLIYYLRFIRFIHNHDFNQDICQSSLSLSDILQCEDSKCGDIEIIDMSCDDVECT